MQAFKQFLQFYFVGIAIVFINALIFGNKPITVLTSPGLYILPVIFCAIGFIIGLIIFELNLRPVDKKQKIFFFSYCFGSLALLTITIVLSINRIREINHKKQFENVESNHKAMKTWVYANEEYIRIAFNRLEKEFKNPNEFILDGFSVRKHDTIINGSQDTVYNIYFYYLLSPGTTNIYFSKISVIASVPELKLYNIDAKKSEEYLGIDAERKKHEAAMIKELKNSVIKTKDSLEEKK